MPDARRSRRVRILAILLRKLALKRFARCHILWHDLCVSFSKLNDCQLQNKEFPGVYPH